MINQINGPIITYFAIIVSSKGKMGTFVKFVMSMFLNNHLLIKRQINYSVLTASNGFILLVIFF